MTDDNDIDEQTMHAARRLPKERQPGEDLWPGIESGIVSGIVSVIERPVRQRTTPWFAQAAAVVLLIGASSAVTYFVMNEQPSPVVVVDASNVFEQVAFTSRYSLGSDFTDARNFLVAELDVELAKLPPESRMTFETNLHLMHQAIAETNAALEEELDNTVLQGRLLRAYQDELELLRRVSRLSRNVMLRNDI